MQEYEAASHIAPTIRKQRPRNAAAPLTTKHTYVKSFCLLLSIQSGTPCHKLMLLTVIVGLPTSAQALWKHPSSHAVESECKMSSTGSFD